MYDNCRTLLDHVIAVYAKRGGDGLLRTVEHLFACAQRGDCPERRPCLEAVADVRARILENEPPEP